METDWAPYSFTMNWIFTRPGAEVRFEQGEPFCHIFPVARGALEAVEPELRPLSATPELEAQHRQWAESRITFNAELAQRTDGAWQKGYFPRPRTRRRAGPGGRPPQPPAAPALQIRAKFHLSADAVEPRQRKFT